MRAHKKTFGLFILLLAATFSLTLLTGISNQKQGTAVGAQRKDATPIQQEGRMTEKQREHSKLYKEYKPDGNLRTLAESSAGDVEVVNGIPQKVFFSSSPPFNLQEFLRGMAHDSDAVVIGVVNKKASFLTEDENFIFSDYDFYVEEILKDNGAHPIDVKEITVTRPGGAIVLGQRAVCAIDESLEPLALGNRYLLFLKFIPSTCAYKAFNSKGSFLLDGNKAVKLTHEDLPFEIETGTETSSLIARIRSAVQ